MDKFLKNLWRQVRHYKCTAIGLLLCAAILTWIYGCESQVKSLVTPGKLVTRAELNIEVTAFLADMKIKTDTFMATAEVRVEDLDQQDAFKQELVKYALLVAEGGTVNPVGVALGLAGIMGLATAGDNIKKDGIITGYKKKPVT